MASFEFAINNQTVIASGSFLHDSSTDRQATLFWNIAGPITGTSPTIQFSLKEVDPSDRTTFIGQTITSSVINTTGTGQISLLVGISSLVSVGWTVGGTTPSFGATSIGVISGPISTSSGLPNSSAPTYSAGQVSPLSLNLSGGLRVDGSGATQPVSGTIAATESGIWTIRNQDGYGVNLTALTGTPTGAETGLVTRNIPSGSQTVAQSNPANLQATIQGLFADNSINSTSKVAILPARANTAAPTWTDGYQVPLSADTSGNLRTINSSIGANNSTAPTSSTQIAGFDGTNLVPYRYSVPSYMASTNGLVSSGTIATTVTSIAYYFHSAAVTKRAEIYRIEISYATFNNTGSTGSLTFRGARITAENATPGGTAESINPMDTADAAGTGTFRVGATGTPTRTTGDLFSYATSTGAQAGLIVWEPTDAGKPIVLRAGVAEGFEIRTVVATTLTTAVQVAVQFYWTER